MPTPQNKSKVNDWKLIADRTISHKDRNNHVRVASITIEQRATEYKMEVTLTGGGDEFDTDSVAAQGDTPHHALERCREDALGIAAGFSALFNSRLSNAMRCVVYEAIDAESDDAEPDPNP